MEDKIQAGRELDALIAEQVMGWTKHRNDRPSTSVESARLDWEYDWVPPQWKGNTAYQKKLPHYSTEIVAAWQVLELAFGYTLDTLQLSGPGKKRQVIVDVRVHFRSHPLHPTDSAAYTGKARVLKGEEACGICVAALRAFGVLPPPTPA